MENLETVVKKLDIIEKYLEQLKSAISNQLQAQSLAEKYQSLSPQNIRDKIEVRKKCIENILAHNNSLEQVCETFNSHYSKTGKTMSPSSFALNLQRWYRDGSKPQFRFAQILAKMNQETEE